MLAEFAHHSNVAVSMQECFFNSKAQSFDPFLYAPEMRGSSVCSSASNQISEAGPPLTSRKRAVRDLVLSTEQARRDIADLRVLVRRLHLQVVDALGEEPSVPPPLRGGGGHEARKQGRSG
uniref:Uncharacterized protein n=2 Tax=Cryptomonas curvata TaxID=233186 RepID=A0A7S0N1J6_9CRYP|mmetsp:Transcript_58555/g.122377  ORF Transcript_58555/g.122377 Transcript_58555/m.122377 type:complete len:121 (+) Transcript_58555:455-817(+)